MSARRLHVAALAAAFIAAAMSPIALADRISDIRNTRHNLSASGPGTARASTETQVCVFCHTPHGATRTDDSGASVRSPLWNRRIPAGSTYTPYTSSSLDAAAIQGSLDQPGGSSKLCLSCHDGTIAIGNVNVLQGLENVTISMTGTGAGGTMPPGGGTTSGFTRNLGVDLRNDHPISVTYNDELARRDGELRGLDANQRYPAGTGTVIGVRVSGRKPMFPLEPTGAASAGQVQCATCHDPHIRETDVTRGPQKFLRGQRFQEASPSPTGYSEATDIVCMACHDKNSGSGSWAYSAHANPLVADETYTPTAASQREFPTSIPVWKAACLNCHDTHTVQGARRLTREGTDSLATPKQGGSPALEQTCYQCHTLPAKSVLSNATQVPNIESDFALARRMPITTTDQSAASEPHDIGGGISDAGYVDCRGPTNKCGADFIESRANLQQRHVECTDCHNPHRAIRNRLFNGNAAVPDAAGTHRHDEVAGYTHTNIASGALRGTFGVEPIYGSASFQQMPTSFIVKRGDPGNSVDVTTAAPYVTREYQICLKCHSNYGFNDNNLYPLGTRPVLGYPGGTPSGTNNLTQYTNVAKESQAPITHKGQTTTTDSGAGSAFATNNHRSWHPMMDNTGRQLGTRGITSGNPWLLPWSNAVGTQTMYCSDCHGSNVTSGTSVVPDGGENGNPWGPHGSNNDFVLKGAWNANSATLCFKCHDRNVYSPVNDSRKNSGTTGFCCRGGDQLHWYHWNKITGSDPGRPLKCNWCHAAVPHGWKNKALLVNLNDVGPEAGQPGNAEWRMGSSAQAYNQEPYYLNAKVKIRTFATSGNWTDTNCGSRGVGPFFGTGTNNTQTGKDWMKDVCSNPP
jgi:predicted CXXCH cytochrome family protein